MVFLNELSSGSPSSDDSVTCRLPKTISCKEWSGVAEDLHARCQRQSTCMKLVAFESVDTGRKFLACAEKDEQKCSYLEWVDQVLPLSLKICLARIWSMYEEENRVRLRENVVNAAEYMKMRKKQIRMGNELRYVKLDYVEIVFQKEEALSQLASAKQILIELKAELEKKNLADHTSVV